jgi:Ala-tRNA(Pro) deacylase
MSVSERVVSFLRANHVDFDVQTHRPTKTSARTAEVAHVPAECVAKGVVLEDGDQLVMAVIPANRRVDEQALGEMLHCSLRLVSEEVLAMVFRDCRMGAIPPLGAAWGIATIVDESLLRQRQLYFEGGDHEVLIRVSGAAFGTLMIGNRSGSFSN